VSGNAWGAAEVRQRAHRHPAIIAHDGCHAHAAPHLAAEKHACSGRGKEGGGRPGRGLEGTEHAGLECSGFMW
jgi:hypothetical protein